MTLEEIKNNIGNYCLYQVNSNYPFLDKTIPSFGIGKIITVKEASYYEVCPIELQFSNSSTVELQSSEIIIIVNPNAKLVKLCLK